jgi:hypothetical protein
MVMGAFNHLAASRNHAGTRRQLDSESYRRRENQYRRRLGATVVFIAVESACIGFLAGDNSRCLVGDGSLLPQRSNLAQDNGHGTGHGRIQPPSSKPKPRGDPFNAPGRMML